METAYRSVLSIPALSQFTMAVITKSGVKSKFLFYNSPSELLYEACSMAASALTSNSRVLWLSDDTDLVVVHERLRETHGLAASKLLFSERLCFSSLAELVVPSSPDTPLSTASAASVFLALCDAAHADGFSTCTIVADLSSVPEESAVEALIASSVVLGRACPPVSATVVWLCDVRRLHTAAVACALAVAGDALYNGDVFANPVPVMQLPDFGHLQPAGVIISAMAHMAGLLTEAQKQKTELALRVEQLERAAKSSGAAPEGSPALTLQPAPAPPLMGASTLRMLDLSGAGGFGAPATTLTLGGVGGVAESGFEDVMPPDVDFF